MSFVAYAKYDLKVIFGNKKIICGEGKHSTATHYENYTVKCIEIQPNRLKIILNFNKN